jgi:hypothetical protein
LANSPIKLLPLEIHTAGEIQIPGEKKIDSELVFDSALCGFELGEIKVLSVDI